ncbi:MAG: hypothetical protein OEU26_26565, partial [Candidatus Tectomicrobia bacterium]|nr:hypothetical protein [Candidatus Tectomicrobia bacterium]
MAGVQDKEPQHAVAVVVRDWLLNNRPADLPETITVNGKSVPVSIVARLADVAAVERPAVVIEATVVGQSHIKLLEMRLRVRLATQGDDTTGAAAAGWMYAVTAALETAVAGLRTALEDEGYWLRRMLGGASEAREDGERSNELWKDYDLGLAPLPMVTISEGVSFPPNPDRGDFVTIRQLRGVFEYDGLQWVRTFDWSVELLDLTEAHFAWSHQALGNSGYEKPVMRVARTDGEEMDLLQNELGQQTFWDWAGLGAITLVTYYDQTGNNRDLTQHNQDRR